MISPPPRAHGWEAPSLDHPQRRTPRRLGQTPLWSRLCFCCLGAVNAWQRGHLSKVHGEGCTDTPPLAAGLFPAAIVPVAGSGFTRLPSVTAELSCGEAQVQPPLGVGRGCSRCSLHLLYAWFYLFCRAGGGSQGLTCAKQALYHQAVARGRTHLCSSRTDRMQPETLKVCCRALILPPGLGLGPWPALIQPLPSFSFRRLH